MEPLHAVAGHEERPGLVPVMHVDLPDRSDVGRAGGDVGQERAPPLAEDAAAAQQPADVADARQQQPGQRSVASVRSAG